MLYHPQGLDFFRSDAAVGSKIKVIQFSFQISQSSRFCEIDKKISMINYCKDSSDSSSICGPLVEDMNPSRMTRLVDLERCLAVLHPVCTPPSGNKGSPCHVQKCRNIRRTPPPPHHSPPHIRLGRWQNLQISQIQVCMLKFLRNMYRPNCPTSRTSTMATVCPRRKYEFIIVLRCCSRSAR